MSEQITFVSALMRDMTQSSRYSFVRADTTCFHHRIPENILPTNIALVVPSFSHKKLQSKDLCLKHQQRIFVEKHFCTKNLQMSDSVFSRSVHSLMFSNRFTFANTFKNNCDILQ